MPRLLKAPPLVEILFAPVTVTPEMKRLPPASMAKILKSPLLPSMVSDEALEPLMDTVPAEPPVIAVLASMMLGNTDANLMV